MDIAGIPTASGFSTEAGEGLFVRFKRVGYVAFRNRASGDAVSEKCHDLHTQNHRFQCQVW